MSHSRTKRWGIFASALALALSACSDGGNGGEEPPTSLPETTTSTSSVNLPPETDLTEEAVPTASGAFPQAQTAPGQQVDTGQFLNMVIQHADQIWVPYFTGLGLQEPMVDVVYVGSPQDPTFNSACDLNENGLKGDDVITASTPNAWYCSDDGGSQWQGAILLPLVTFSNMWNGTVLNGLSTRGGDFAAAVVAAHEFGHHVADELAEQLGVSEEWGSKKPELTADCFAGVWAAGADSQGYLEPGDIDEGLAAMIALGVNGSKTHGTASERSQAFMAGWNAQHQPYACMTNYWPSLAKKLATM